MILEFEALAFGLSCLYFLVKIEKQITKVATTIELCPNCPHEKIEEYRRKQDVRKYTS